MGRRSCQPGATRVALARPRAVTGPEITRTDHCAVGCPKYRAISMRPSANAESLGRTPSWINAGGTGSPARSDRPARSRSTGRRCAGSTSRWPRGAGGRGSLVDTPAPDNRPGDPPQLRGVAFYVADWMSDRWNIPKPIALISAGNEHRSVVVVAKPVVAVFVTHRAIPNAARKQSPRRLKS